MNVTVATVAMDAGDVPVVRAITPDVFVPVTDIDGLEPAPVPAAMVGADPAGTN